jgi:hypothetical protein
MRRALAVVALVVGLGLTACGVSPEWSADRADPDDVPFGLLDESPPSSGGVSRPGVQADLYLYEPTSRRLVRVVATIDGFGVADIVLGLQDGATAESAPGENPLADADLIQSVELSRGLVTVDLSEDFVGLGGTEQLIALAEIVYTATARPGVGQVSFTLEGDPIEIPRGDGSLTSDAVTRGDYRELAPLDE